MAINRTLIPRTGPLSLAMLAGAVFSLSATASEAPGGDDKPYTVVDGAVDKGNL